MPISAGRLASARRALNRNILSHTYSRTVKAAGAEDAWGETDPTTGTVTTGVACLWATRATVARDGGGTTTIAVPNLTVSAADPLAVGDYVSAITGSDGVVLAAGSFRVERLLDDTAGLGAALLPTWELKSAQVQS